MSSEEKSKDTKKPEETEKPTRVIVCVDEGHRAEAALQYYKNFMHRADNEVIVLHVSDSVQVPAYHLMAVVNQETIQQETDYIRSKNSKIKANYLKLCQEYNFTQHKFITVAGEHGYGPSIISNVEKFGASLVVIGSRQLNKIASALLGSVSSYVIHHSRVPVCICPPPAHK